MRQLARRIVYKGYQAKLGSAIVLVCLCVVTAYSQRQALTISGEYQLTFWGNLLFQFNTYPFFYLFRLPIFIVASQKLFRLEKESEYIITRFTSRRLFTNRCLLDLTAFTLFYHILEVLLVAAIFLVGHVNNIDKAFAFHLSIPLQNYFNLGLDSCIDLLKLELFIFIVTVFQYLIFAKLVMLSSIRLGRSLFSTSIPFILNFLLLILIKVDFWFRGKAIRCIFPHKNFFLNYINEYGAPGSLNSLFYPTIYWLCIIFVCGFFFYYIIERQDFLFSPENIDREE